MKTFLSRNKVVIVAILLTFMITSSLTVYATLSYKATEIEFTSHNANFKASTVSEALDTLHYSATTKNYSTEEQVVGTWIDGKPIYRKVIDIGTPVRAAANNTKIYNASDLNIEKTITIDLYHPNMVIIVNHLTHWYDSSTGFITAYGETNNYEDIKYIILEYTKTTD